MTIAIDDTTLACKELRVRTIISDAADSADQGAVVVGFSGGVDSSLLLWESVHAVGSHRVIAVTATSPTSIPDGEEQARRFAADLKVRHFVIPTGECADAAFTRNPPDRCYLCKRIRYSHIVSLAESLGPAVVLDGSQADDHPSDRPGMRALEERGILSPLALAGIGKAEVRRLLRGAGFPDLATMRAEPCLATRIPTGDPITEEALERIRKGESCLKACGIDFVRLRHHDPWARIVTDEAGMAALATNCEMRQEVIHRLKELGYRYVTLDLEEYGTAHETGLGAGAARQKEGDHPHAEPL